MSGRLTGKIAIVTGGTSGIGETTVRLFVSEGARVVIVARRAGPGEQLVAELGPDTTRFISGDVAREATARTAIDLAESWGGLDVLVNNAAMDWVSPILDTSEADVRRVLDTNFIGAFLMQREAARRMLERGRGSIINLTSRNASVGVPTPRESSLMLSARPYLTRDHCALMRDRAVDRLLRLQVSWGNVQTFIGLDHRLEKSRVVPSRDLLERAVAELDAKQWVSTRRQREHFCP